jgi:hypothetical protein
LDYSKVQFISLNGLSTGHVKERSFAASIDVDLVGSPAESMAMKREAIRVEPISSYLAKWKAPISSVTRAGGTA